MANDGGGTDQGTDRGTANAPTTDGPNGLPVDERFRILSKRRRRLLLSCLKDRDRPMAVADLARDLATRPDEVGADSEQTPEDVHTTLVHTTLPYLDQFGVVRYDRERGTVALGPNATHLVPLVELARPEGDGTDE